MTGLNRKKPRKLEKTKNEADMHKNLTNSRVMDRHKPEVSTEKEI